MDLAANARDLLNAIGSGHTGAAEIGAGAAAGTTALQSKITAAGARAGDALGQYLGTDFIKAVSGGASKGSNKTQAAMVQKALGAVPSWLPWTAGAAAILAALYFYRRK